MELLDVYDDYGNKTNRTVIRGDKSVKLSPNEHIALSTIFIQNSEGYFLIQKTSSEKGGKFSSNGGHVGHNETPLSAVKREVLEELGIDISNDDIIDLGHVLYDIPLRYIYYLKKDIDIKKIVLQDDKVLFVKYMSIDEVNDLIKNDKMLESHGIIFNKVLEYLKKPV